jgi:hypothetical protein
MLGWLRHRLTYANVIATLALFLVLSNGVAYALAINSVRSINIVNGQVKSVDLRDNGVKSIDVKDGALTGVDVADHSLTAADIDQSTLNLTGSSIQDGSLTLADLGGTDGNGLTQTTTSPIPLAAGACQAALTANFGDGVVGDLVIGTLTDASGNAVLPNTAAVMPAIVIKTTQGGAVPNLVVCNTGTSPLTIPTGSVFHWRLIDA